MAESFAITNPASGELIEQIQLAEVADVDVAVRKARDAQRDWARTSPGERAAVLLKVANLLEERADEFALTETRQCGKPIKLSKEFDVPGTIDNAAFFAGAVRSLEGKASGEYSADHTSTIRREAVGVIGSIAPWNYPLNMAGWKVFPALAAGNAVVIKPAEITPLTTVMLAQAFADAGLPDGLLTVLIGRGRDVGEALVSHEYVDMVSFTGSTPVGRRIAELAARAPKRVHLELGGKAPFLVFDDASLEAAVHGAVAGALLNGGQDCTAATRAYVQRPLFDAFVEGVAEVMRSVKMGNPEDPATDLGSLVSATQAERVHGFVSRALDQGAKAVVGGGAPRGAFYEPTLIVGAAHESEIVQDEVFGPVLAAVPFDSDDQGLALANDTRYGLAASAWTSDVFRAGRASREIAAGCVWINDHIPIVSEMPHGGMKASGYGKDMSSYALEEYTVVKHVMSENTGVARKPWHRTVFSHG
ncbi:betaine-aldehyde dehydrogenase [Amycolatopsis xylanica]|uniref:Betaine-aldehyde dehydrogenase n=1 Tax=Amycolatopsis xylanica TaxID=589385 RepID=A0A1H2ZVX0_9PSEU|nr:gamma-aminobutyraldehyde dehydrogenase [Amycolatopsis xylanica]SDX20809.1 betaine-aldehyde dehydrogenase [Amycolatopsis xylanica]